MLLFYIAVAVMYYHNNISLRTHHHHHPLFYVAFSIPFFSPSQKYMVLLPFLHFPIIQLINLVDRPKKALSKQPRTHKNQHGGCWENNNNVCVFHFVNKNKW